MENNEAEEDLGVKPEGEEDAESSPGEEPDNFKWSLRSRSVSWVYCSFCQCG